MSYKLNYTDRFKETIREMDRPEGKMEGGGQRMRKWKWLGCEPWRFDREKWVPQEIRARKLIRSHRDLDVFNPSTGSGQRLAYTLALWNNACIIGPTLWNETYSIGQPPCDNAYSTGLAMEVFRLTARFPMEERYALVDQMRRLS